MLKFYFSGIISTREKREGSGAGSGSAPLINGSVSRRPKNMRIRIPNTGFFNVEFAGVIRRHRLQYNPNLCEEGVRGRLDPHGLVLVLACGTLHNHQTVCGVFEQVFYHQTVCGVVEQVFYHQTVCGVFEQVFYHQTVCGVFEQVFYHQTVCGVFEQVFFSFKWDAV